MCKWIFFFLLTTGVMSADPELCRKVTKFEAICVKFDTIFILATHPCTETDYVNLVIARTGSPTVPSFFDSQSFHRKDNSSKEVVFDSQRKVVLDIHSEDKASKQLHVSLSVTSLNNTGGTSGAPFPFILDVYFDIDIERCVGFFPLVYIPEKPINDSYCHNSKREINRKASICHKGRDSTIITILDVCTSPYQLHVFFYGNGIQFHKILTQADGTFYPLKVPGTLGGECGLIFKEFYSFGSPLQQQHVKLLHYCKDTNTTKVLVDRSYYTSYGMMCGPSICSKTKLTEHRCEILNNSTVTYDLQEQCNNDYSLKLGPVMGVNFTDLFLKNNGVETLISNLSKESTKKLFDLDTESFISFTVSKKVGFSMLLDLVVLVNTAELTFPLLRDEFHYIAHSACKSSVHHVYFAVKIIVPVLCLLALILIGYFCYQRYKKRKNITYDQSLPYQIDLGDDDDFPFET